MKISSGVSGVVSVKICTLKNFPLYGIAWVDTIRSLHFVANNKQHWIIMPTNQATIIYLAGQLGYLRENVVKEICMYMAKNVEGFNKILLIPSASGSRDS